jgi:hypothetical protein
MATPAAKKGKTHFKSQLLALSLMNKVRMIRGGGYTVKPSSKLSQERWSL